MSEAPHPEPAPAPPAKSAPAAQPHDFRQSSLLSPRQLRALRAHETQFLHAMGSRLALSLRTDFPLKLAGIQIVTYRKLTESWEGPTHLILFKAEPLRGVSVLEIPLALGLTMVDRLMGGPGRVEQKKTEISEIEKALLDQVVQIILEEWCNNWAAVKTLKPTVLGCESSGRFLQTAPPETNMLTLAMDARLGDCAGQIKLAVPYTALDPCLRQLSGGSEPVSESPAPASSATVQWNRALDNVELPLTAEWQGLELSARDLLHLKVGDVLQISSQVAQEVCVRLGDLAKFNGRLGTVAGHWAVALNPPIKP
jgi:flagellar motor switch protein FliM